MGIRRVAGRDTPFGASYTIESGGIEHAYSPSPSEYTLRA